MRTCVALVSVRVRESTTDFTGSARCLYCNVELQILDQTASLVVCDGHRSLDKVQMRAVESTAMQPMKALDRGLACGHDPACTDMYRAKLGRMG